jgi:molecular chaperone GrpE
MSKDKHSDNKAASSESKEIPVTSPDEETSPEATVVSAGDELRGRCSQLETRVAELEDQRLRALAELDNYKKRMARQFEDVVRTANDKLLGELLEVVDNFERALSHSRESEESSDENNRAVREGTELIYNQLKTLLTKYGVRPIEAVGRAFDPALHEAMLQMDSDEHAAGMVAQELNRGYLVDDRVLRHSRVAVSRGKAQDNERDN